MKKDIVLRLLMLIIIVSLAASCTQTAATPTKNPELTSSPETKSAPTNTATPTQAPTPTETALPTATPAPIPCTIAFESDRDGNLEIYSMAPDGSALVNLSSNTGQDSSPAWSPDGSQIAFASNRENEAGGGQFIYIMDADGGNVRQVTWEDNSNWPDWSPDGTFITYTHHGDIYIIKADGSAEAVNLTNSPEKDEQSTWSPDGRKIAWLVGEGNSKDIYIMDSDGANQQKLTDNTQAFDVQWTIDGELFTHWNHPEGVCEKCVMGADGSNIRDAGGKGELQRFTPFRTLDGDRVECVGIDLIAGNEEIYLVSDMYPDIFLNLTNAPGNDREPDWPANCLAGFEGVGPMEEAAPEIEQTQPSVNMVLGYAGDTPEQKERAQDMQTACDELGIQVLYGDIPDLVEKGVDAIIQNTNQNSVDALRDDIQKARDKGVPVFLLDAETNTDGAYSISIDHDHWAKTSLGWMLEKIGGKGQIAYFDLDPFHRYTHIINDLLLRYPGVTVVDFRDGDYDPGKIKPETGDFVKQYPELKAIWSSYSNFQAMWGLEENGIPYHKWPVMLCEANVTGLETWARIQAAYPGFDCFASVNPPGIAYAAVYAAYYLENGYQIDKAVLGGRFGRTLYVNLPTITKDNYQEKLNELLKNETYYVDELMSPEEIREAWFLE